jgi:beta-phosphoglucomutase-like phosphatase (HAD superfamily)
VVIEDSAAGVQGALVAGMRVIGFTGGAHCGPDHADKLRQAGARTIIEQMMNLPEAVRL